MSEAQDHQAHESLAELSFLPMQVADLEEALGIEAVSHLHPWTRGNFTDSLAAGHWAYCIRPQVEQAIKGSYLDPSVLWAYCILFPAVDELHLLNITVSPKLRKLGLGSRIMASIESVAAQQNIPRIILEVRPSNTAAIGLYHKLGYEQIGIRKNYYPASPNSGGREDAVVMAKSIKLEP
ncbi:ribosomal protein S18-alanine N-acetyltransferase [Polynucleobacter alcilacus]|uniref:ribosomal protein S18-alanine N-acetyltransferase n=1 Tax=Polynucleobacter alcilacus TaxID=1819739 RepID=UPI001C0CBD85|nr:ribosomal protein S18-alanine N-acetyltransferase [Polynucleobacter alcilacus]MBU3566850.1 ribosomal protein S18-alanine N-acetyltransferase [Polynucleobacter alcilacus]